MVVFSGKSDFSFFQENVPIGSGNHWVDFFAERDQFSWKTKDRPFRMSRRLSVKFFLVDGLSGDEFPGKRNDTTEKRVYFLKSDEPNQITKMTSGWRWSMDNLRDAYYLVQLIVRQILIFLRVRFAASVDFLEKETSEVLLPEEIAKEETNRLSRYYIARPTRFITFINKEQRLIGKINYRRISIYSLQSRHCDNFYYSNSRTNVYYKQFFWGIVTEGRC